MRKRLAVLFLSLTVTLTGISAPVMAEDFSDSAVVAEQETDTAEITLEPETEEAQEQEADVSVENTEDEEEENAITSDDAEENPSESEETDLFTSENTVDSVGTTGGNINWNYPDGLIPTDTEMASEGCVLVGVLGSYVTDAQNALKLINQYRKEACDKGYPDPRDSGRKLTSADYVPIKWSSDLEYIARIRAAEASAVLGHTRPNGESCFSLTSPNGIDSCAEVLAWNSFSDSMLTGIQQWYMEKDDWVNRNEDAVTGHYTSMIDPDNLYVGVGCFLSDTAAYANSTAGEFSGYSDLDETKAPSMKDYIQVIEVQRSGLETQLMLADAKIKTGKTTEAVLALGTEANWTFCLDGITAEKVTWSSSNAKVATVDQEGTVRGIASGKATITANAGNGIKASATITVEKQTVKLSKTKITIGNCTYTGANVKPSVKITYGNQTLKVGKDYTYTYTKASQTGKTIKVTIKGKGTYTGTVTKTVKISAKSISKVTVKGVPITKTATGKQIRPTVVVYDGKKKLSTSDYKVTYGKNTAPGKATIKISGKGNYKGSVSRTFYIVPGKAAISKVTAGKKKFTVSCRKMSGVSGYQIAYSTNKNKQYRYVNVSAQNASMTITQLTSQKTYYVKVRAYKKIDGKTLYGKYSTIKSVKVK
ncbi:CAP domain-containing protein [Blautia sp. MSJ-19]|uniref:CAP domain-containing protein n=1 Tax=Blautia sp. MSJ-19 TaxID=2841517 RepID=UPI001C0F3362|nr:CAP domain-containing protein [Blautia sp. MSJ-19]MBU5481629.1 Ig-like domain-containing protein [Blautia sp. MSJ-19]